MKLYKSKIKPNKILHIIFKKSDFKKMNEDSRKDLIEPDQFIQLSTMKLKKGQSFKPHFHIWKNGEEKIIAQEEDSSKGGIFQFLQANLLSDTSN